MPAPVHVVAISENIPFGGEIALLSSIVLEGNYRFITASSSQNNFRKEFLQYCESIAYAHVLNPLIRDFKLPESIDFQNIHLWLALDDEGTKTAKGLYEKSGDFSNKGRLSFPERVVKCDFIVPDISNPENFRQVHGFLVEQLTPWKELIWKVMCDYS